MKRTVARLAVSVCLLAGAVPALGAQEPCTDNPWSGGWQPAWHPAYDGIDWAGACTTINPAGTGKPRKQNDQRRMVGRRVMRIA